MSEQETGVKRVRARHSQQFKVDAVKLVIDEGRAVNEVARNLGISAETLRLWKKKYEQERGVAQRAFPGKGHMSPEEEELRQVKRQLQQAEQERDILKKALAFFSRTEK